MVYLFVGYLALWAITFGYVFSLGARQKRLQQELERLSDNKEASTSLAQTPQP